MTWFKLDDQAAFDAKVMEAGNEAFGAWCRAGCWSSAHLTEGLIPRATALTIGPARLWARLVEAKAGHEHGLCEVHPDGWQIHDFLDWNPTAAKVRDTRDATRDRLTKWREKRACNAVTTAVTNSVGNASGNAAPVPVPVPGPLDPDPSGGSAAVAATEPTPKAKRARKPKPEAATQGPGPLAVAWGLWRSTYESSRRNYGRYTSAPADGKVMETLAAHAAKLAAERAHEVPEAEREGLLEALLRHWFREYLRDEGSKTFVLADQKHGLQWLARGLPVYGSPWAKSRPRPAAARAPDVAPQLPAPTREPGDVPPPPGFMAEFTRALSGIGGGGSSAPVVSTAERQRLLQLQAAELLEREEAAQ